MNIRKDILNYNTRQGIEPVLSTFFNNALNKLIEIGAFSPKIEDIRDFLVTDLATYKNKYNL